MPDADLMAEELVREFLAVGADLDQAAEVIRRTRYLGAPEVSSQLPESSGPQGGGGPGGQRAGRPADSPLRLETTHPEAGGGGTFYVTMQRGKQTAYLLGPYDTMEQAEGEVPRGRRLAEQVDPRSAFDAFGVTRVVMQPGVQPPPGKLNSLPVQEPAVVAYRHREPVPGLNLDNSLPAGVVGQRAVPRCRR